jgi:hypothetical protein
MNGIAKRWRIIVEKNPSPTRRIDIRNAGIAIRNTGHFKPAKGHFNSVSLVF